MPLQLKTDFKFTTFIPEINTRGENGIQSFIAIKTNDNLPINEAAVITAVEGRVLFQKGKDDTIDSFIASTQLAPKAGEPGEFLPHAFEIVNHHNIAEGPPSITEVLSRPNLGEYLQLPKLGHDYERTSENRFEIKRSIGGVLALDFSTSADGITFTEIKETPGIEPPIYDKHRQGEPRPLFPIAYIRN